MNSNNVTSNINYYLDKIKKLKQNIEDTYNFILDVTYNGSIENYILKSPKYNNTNITPIFEKIITFISAIESISNKIEEDNIVKKEQLKIINEISNEYNTLITSMKYIDFINKNNQL